MKHLYLLLMLAGSWLGLADDQPKSSPRLHAFYYSWYGNPGTDGAYQNWNHPIADNSGRRHSGGEDIGANYYPSLGCYSSHDATTIARHMSWLNQAGVGTISLTWWGTNTFTDQSVPLILDQAHKHHIEVNFHIEPFPGRTASTTRDAICYIMDKYGQHPAFQRVPTHGNRPLFYIYDSYLEKASNWARILSPNTPTTIRNTPYDSVVIGLWVKESDGQSLVEGHFDGFYTYFASDGFTYGSSTRNWPVLAKFAQEHSMLFIPSAGPGYIDTRIRPWNQSTTRDREKGTYYDRMFQAAITCRPSMISITSFNEWHEGTQIEPASPKQSSDFTYLDYGSLPASYYLDRTAFWLNRWLSGAQ